MKSALLVMDIVSSILQMNPNAEEVVTNIATAIASARACEIPIVYIKPNFRTNAPEIHPNNKMFTLLKPRLKNVRDDDFHPLVEPQDTDFIVGKFRVGAFSGNELEILLRTLGIEHLILTGISTSGIVLTTVRDAADRDYKITVLSDGCYDRDTSVHDCLMSKVFPKQADVIDIASWIENNF